MKSKEIYFVEKQRTPLWTHIVFIAFVAGLEILLFNTSQYLPQEANFRYGIFALTELVLLLKSINTYMNNEGIFVRYFPFMLKYKFFSWAEIENIEIKTINFLKEYDAYGIRTNIFAPKIYKFLGLKKSFFSDTAYVMNGKCGLQIELKNGNRILISTRRQLEIEEILNTIPPIK